MATAVIGALRVNLSADTAAFQTGLTAAERRLDTFGKRASAQLTTIGNSLKGGLAGLGIVLGFNALTGAIGGAVQMASKLVDVADKIGVTTKALQELRFVATQAGVETGQFDDALARFSTQLGEASRGGGDLFKILQANGVALRNANGEMRPVIELFRDYAGLIANAGSVQERNILTTKAFGRTADEMGNMFRDGAAGIDAGRAAAEKLGLVIDDEKLRRIEELGDKWEAFAQKMGTDVQQAILDVIDSFSQLDKWLKDRAKESGPFGDWLKGLQSLGEPGGIPALPMGMGQQPRQVTNAAAKGDVDPLGMAKAKAMQELQQKLFEMQHLKAKPTVLPPSGDDPLKQQQEEAARRLESLQASLLTEREAELAAYAERMAVLEEFQEKKLVTVAQATEMAADIEQQHRDKMAELDRESFQTRLQIAAGYTDSFSSILDSLSTIVGSESEKQFKINKALSIASATIKGIEAVVSSYAAGAKIGGPALGAAFAAAAAAATGAQIAMIARQQFQGGGGGAGAVTAAGSAGGSAQSGGGAGGGGGAPQQVMYLSINGQQFGREQVRDLARQLVDFQRDGGRVVYTDR